MDTLMEKPQAAEPANEPEWLAQRRAEGRRNFDSLPEPSPKDERWRFASTGRLDTNGYAPAPTPPAEVLEDLVNRSSLAGQSAGRLVFADDTQVHFQAIDPELAAQGVIYLPIEEAIARHPELMKKYFLQESTELGSEKYFGLHAEKVRAGAVLYLPKGVCVEQPFVNYHWSSATGAALFPHTLIIAEDNAKGALVDCYLSETEENKGLAVAVSNIHAGSGANVFRKVVQNWNESCTSFQLDTTVAGRDAQVKNLAVNIGSERARFENQVRIEGPGADVKMYSLTVAERHQEFDQRTFQIHNAGNAVSDLLYKNALLDRSRTIFSGLIKVAEGAQQTDAYQTNRNLLLDPAAEANALPGLEILANDVKCSHGATTGNVDEAALFYMMSRGIPRRTAMQLMVYGFFEEVIEKVESEELAENLRTLIHNKFQAKIS
ncbi:MAG: Fe-S cluster assembly protein SufD [Coraliomargaritaceae bacterium]